MGSRFDSDVRSKDHLKPRKKDGPGPGSYELPSCVNPGKQLKNTTFGKAERDWSDLPKDCPAPNQYKNIIKHTETSYAFSIPKAPKSDEEQLFKQGQILGQCVGHYEISGTFKGALAKSILGGADNKGKKEDYNGIPGPGTYDFKDQFHLPGFVIKPHDNGKRDQGYDPNAEQAEPVGPQRY